MPEPALDIDKLSYSYRSNGEAWVLEGIELRVEPGEQLLLCGASGSGKSTLCRTFNGLIPHFHGGRLRGRVRVGGRDTAAETVGGLIDAVGMVFQNPQVQLFNRTVARELAFGLESLGLAPDEIRRRMERTAEGFGIGHLMERAPHALSGGEQHLVCLAAAMALGPGLVVLDEPFANLDPVHVQRVRAALIRVRRRGPAVVVGEHRLALTAPDAGRTAVINCGRLAHVGVTREVLGLDLESCGLDPPLASRVGLRLGIAPLPLRIGDLTGAAGRPGIESLLAPPMPPPPETEPLVEVEGLSFSADGHPLLDGVDLTLHRGECLAVVGANGAGKTTLLKCVNGLLRPTSGRVRLLGADIAKHRVSKLARQVGIAFQNPASQFFKLTVREELQIGPRVMGRLDPQWIDWLVDLFRLGPLLKRPPYRLSDGEKKRVAFAAALASRPTVLALDEPTAGQDAHFRRALGRLLSELRARGQAVVIVTHDLTFAESNAHRWVVLAAGKVLATGRPDEIMSQPEIMAAAGLLPSERFRLRQLWSGVDAERV